MLAFQVTAVPAGAVGAVGATHVMVGRVAFATVALDPAHAFIAVEPAFFTHTCTVYEPPRGAHHDQTFEAPQSCPTLQAVPS